MALIDFANPTRFLALTARVLPWLALVTLGAVAAGITLAVKAPDEHKLQRSLKFLSGADVELVFRPRLAPHLARPVGLRA